jgi:predicted transcriptional regulator
MGKDMAEQLRKAIRESGYTRYELSKQTGIPQSTLSRFANGITDLNITTASRLTAFLGLELRRVRKGR